MSRQDREVRVERLRAASRRKTEEATARARRAVLALENRRLPVNFNTVADEGNVSKDFLYRHDELRALIMRYRSEIPTQAATPPKERPSEGSAAVKLAIAAAALKNVRAENAALRDENARLRGQILALTR